MSERFPLAGDGSWVELKDPTELRYGDKQRILRSVASGEGDGIDMMNALYALLVVSWQLTPMLPTPGQDIKVIEMLSLDDGNILEKLIEPARERLFPGDPEPSKDTPADEVEAALKDPAHPTAPSVG